MLFMDEWMNMHQRCINRLGNFCLISGEQWRTAVRFIHVADPLTCANAANVRKSIPAAQKGWGEPLATVTMATGRGHERISVRFRAIFWAKFAKSNNCALAVCNNAMHKCMNKHCTGKLPTQFSREGQRNARTP